MSRINHLGVPIVNANEPHPFDERGDVERKIEEVKKLTRKEGV